MHEAIDLLGDAFGDFAGVLEAIRFYAVRNVFSRSVEQVVQVAIRVLLPAMRGVGLLLVPNLSNARAKRRRQPKVGDNRKPLLLGQSNVHHLSEHVVLFGEGRKRIHRLVECLANEAQGEFAGVLLEQVESLIHGGHAVRANEANRTHGDVHSRAAIKRVVRGEAKTESVLDVRQLYGFVHEAVASVHFFCSCGSP